MPESGGGCVLEDILEDMLEVLLKHIRKEDRGTINR
jgi:hypothetical protein